MMRPTKASEQIITSDDEDGSALWFIYFIVSQYFAM